MLTIHPQPSLHVLFETFGYTAGFLLYKRGRRKAGDVLDEHQRWSIIAAASVGGFLGSRLLGILNDAARPISVGDFFAPSGGKTIVGGLLGGWVAVEIVKKLRSIRTRTGDLFVLPLCLGIAIGRIGCFLAGVSDDTYGNPSSLPWAVDFGDGVGRHPTQAYEILFFAALATAFSRFPRSSLPNGRLFRIFLVAYLTWRLAIDFLKPQHPIFGMSFIQWACVAGLAILIFSTLRSAQLQEESTDECAHS